MGTPCILKNDPRSVAQMFHSIGMCYFVSCSGTNSSSDNDLGHSRSCSKTEVFRYEEK